VRALLIAPAFLHPPACLPDLEAAPLGGLFLVWRRRKYAAIATLSGLNL
jgi:hypothetical protein